MTNRERVIASLQHRQPDKTPYNIGFTQEAHRKMVAFYGDPDFARKLGNCFSGLGVGLPDNEVEPGIHDDEFGVRWNRTVDKDIGVVCNTVVTLDNIDTYQFPDPLDPARYAKFDKLPDNPGDAFYFGDIGFSLFERSWTLAGMENILMWMVAEPERLHRLLDRVCEFRLAQINKICSYKTIDMVYFGDDWGQQTGLIMGPQLWREFIKPRLREMYGAVKRGGKYVYIHSCGRVQEIFPDLIELGVDVFNPFQPEVMDTGEMKRQFGDRICFYGGISTQRTLPFGTPEQTCEEVKRLIEVVGKNGGYFAAPAHSTPADAKPENIAAMLDVLRNQ